MMVYNCQIVIVDLLFITFKMTEERQFYGFILSRIVLVIKYFIILFFFFFLITKIFASYKSRTYIFFSWSFIFLYL